MGWLDIDMVTDDNLIMEDILTLPNEISNAFNVEEYEESIANTEAKAAMPYKKWESKHQLYRTRNVCFRCMKEYSEDEQADLNELFNGVAHTECFAVMFEEGCRAYMENTIEAMTGLGNYGSGSGLVFKF
jgi:hypothetical protein